MAIRFERDAQTATFHSPLEDFAEVDVEIEIREDPLTGAQARIVPESFVRPEDEPDIEPVVSDAEGCFFCPDMVDDVTPTYAGVLDDDRGSRGEATSFPNLNPYAGHSNVVALTADHYRPIDGFTTGIFADGLAAALEYVAAVLADDETNASLASVNMNFLRPAGSSIIHPHVQTLVDDRGTNAQRRLLDASRAYYDREGSGYWSDLVGEEAGGEREIASTGAVDWLAPFAPTHHRHVLGVVDDPLTDPESPAIRDLASGLTSVLDAYAAVDLNSFNFALFIAPDEPAMPPVVNLVARSVFDEYYWSDSPFFVVLHDEGVVDVAPETYAAETAECF